jgi:hypothetical protein
LTVEDKIGVVGDAYANAVAGYGSTAGLLALVKRFQDEKEYLYVLYSLPLAIY